MKSFSNETLNFFLQKVLFLLHFGSCQNCMSSANFVAEIPQKLCNKRVLSNREPFPCPSYLDAYLGMSSLTDSLRWL